MAYTVPLLIGGPPAGAIVAATVTGGGDGVNITSLIGTVVTPTIVIILLLLGKLRTEPEVKRLEQSNETMRQTILAKDNDMQQLQAGLVDKAIPALTRSTLILETLAPVIQTEVHLRRHPGGG